MTSSEGKNIEYTKSINVLLENASKLEKEFKNYSLAIKYIEIIKLMQYSKDEKYSEDIKKYTKKVLDISNDFIKKGDAHEDFNESMNNYTSALYIKKCDIFNEDVKIQGEISELKAKTENLVNKKIDEIEESKENYKDKLFKMKNVLNLFIIYKAIFKENTENRIILDNKYLKWVNIMKDYAKRSNTKIKDKDDLMNRINTVSEEKIIEAINKKTIPEILYEEGESIKSAKNLMNSLKTEMRTQWNDVKGMDKFKKKMEQIILDPLIDPLSRSSFEGEQRISMAILLYGPPGTGKTFVVEALANHIQKTLKDKDISSKSRFTTCVYFKIEASDIKSKYVGEGEKKLRYMFDISRYLNKMGAIVVVFLDEVEAYLFNRDSDRPGNVVTEFLTQFSGGISNQDDGLVIIAATNLPQTLDGALRRRFENIYFPLPGYEYRISYIKSLLMKLPQDIWHNLNSEDIQKMTSLLDGFNVSDIARVVNESFVNAQQKDFPFNRLLQAKSLEGDDKYIITPSYPRYVKEDYTIKTNPDLYDTFPITSNENNKNIYRSIKRPAMSIINVESVIYNKIVSSTVDWDMVKSIEEWRKTEGKKA